MRNPFKRKPRPLTRLSDLATTFGLVARLIKSNLLIWDARHRRLFLSAPLATIMLSRGADAWGAFLNNVYLYVVYLHQQEQWEKFLSHQQRKAVAHARCENPALSLFDIDRINRATAAQLAQDDVPTPILQPFEFFIVADTATANPQTVSVGTFDPDSQLFSIVSWDEVQAALSTQLSSEHVNV